jgi:tRNA acetyltransferase TAN1
LIDSDLENELDKLRSQANDNDVFQVLPTHIECIVFVRIPSDQSPTFYVHQLIQDIQTSSRDIRYIQRVTPLEMICSANLCDIEKNIKPLVDQHFHQESQLSYTFAVMFKARNSQRLSKDETILRIASMVGLPHTVNLDRPDKTIVIEIFRNIAGMCIIEDYIVLKRYNLTELSAHIRMKSMACEVSVGDSSLFFNIDIDDTMRIKS